VTRLPHINEELDVYQESLTFAFRNVGAYNTDRWQGDLPACDFAGSRF